MSDMFNRNDERDNETRQAILNMRAVPTVTESDLAEAQNARHARYNAANVAAFDEYESIISMNKQDEQKMYGDRAVAGAAMLADAARNPNGLSDRSLSKSLSQAFGRPIFGAQILSGLKGKEAMYNGYAVIKGQVDNGKGGQTIGDVALLTPIAQLRIFQNAKIGDRAIGYRQKLYDGLMKQYTKDQLTASGISDPNGVEVVGSTSIPNLTRRHSSISAFGADGKGGMRRYYSGPETGYQVVQEDVGDKGYKWHALRSGFIPEQNAYGTIYENTETGETRFVGKGENIADSDAIRAARINTKRDLMKDAAKNETALEVARIKKEGYENSARIKAQGQVDTASARGTGGSGGTGTSGTGGAKGAPKFDKDKYAALKEMRDEILYPYTEAIGYDRSEPRELDEPQKKKVNDIEKAMAAMLPLGDDEEKVERVAGKKGDDDIITADEDTRARALKILAARRAKSNAK